MLLRSLEKIAEGKKNKKEATLKAKKKILDGSIIAEANGKQSFEYPRPAPLPIG